ncbi:MAG: ABC transporter permease [Chloroflexi bacterium]|nr:ABC transporter permease [Chloroflexota bacterium]
MLSDALQQPGVRSQKRSEAQIKDSQGMSLLNTIAEAWEGLVLNKLRSFLTTLGIIIGVAAVIIMLAVSSGAEAAIADQIGTLGANLIMITPFRAFGGVRGPGGGGPGQFAGGAPTQSLTYEDALALEAAQLDGISGVSVEQTTNQPVAGGPSNTSETGVSVVGVTPDYLTVRDYSLGEGRFFTDDENTTAQRVTVLGSGIASDLFPGEDPVGQDIKIGSIHFTIVGVMTQQGTVNGQDNDGRVYVPAMVVFKKFSQNRVGGHPVRIIYAKASNPALMTTVSNEITDFLAQRHKVDPSEADFGVRTQQDIIDARASTTATFRSLLAWVAAVSLVVGGIGIMNIMLVNVTERTREIGLRQALGARPLDVQRQFLFEAVMLSLAGGLVGVLLGIVGSYAFAALGGMRTQIVPLSLPLAFAAAAIVGIFFGYYPATQAAKLDPIDALRRE